MPHFCSRPHPGDVGAALGVAGPQSYDRTLPTHRACLPVAPATFTLPPLGLGLPPSRWGLLSASICMGRKGRVQQEPMGALGLGTCSLWGGAGTASQVRWPGFDTKEVEHQ